MLDLLKKYERKSISEKESLNNSLNISELKSKNDYLNKKIKHFPSSVRE